MNDYAKPDDSSVQSSIEFSGGRFTIHADGKQWTGRVIAYARSERWVNAAVNLTFEPPLEQTDISPLAVGLSGLFCGLP